MSSTAAVTTRDARTRAGPTQLEPSFHTLSKLVAAAGFELTIRLSPLVKTTRLRASVNQNGPELVRSLRRLGASNIRLFGSVARGDNGPDSDVELLVDLGPDVGLFALGRMRTEAERILGTRVDIVPAGELKADVANHVLAEAVPLRAVPTPTGSTTSQRHARPSPPTSHELTSRKTSFSTRFVCG